MCSPGILGPKIKLSYVEALRRLANGTARIAPISIPTSLVLERPPTKHVLNIARAQLPDGKLGVGVRLTYADAVQRILNGSLRILDDRDNLCVATQEHDHVAANNCIGQASANERKDESLKTDLSDDGKEYVLEKVLRHCGKGRSMQFFVKYQDYDDISWQPMRNFILDDKVNIVVLNYLKKHKLFRRACLETWIDA